MVWGRQLRRAAEEREGRRTDPRASAGAPTGELPYLHGHVVIGDGQRDAGFRHAYGDDLDAGRVAVTVGLQRILDLLIHLYGKRTGAVQRQDVQKNTKEISLRSQIRYREEPAQ
jgi:hypothetical protein